LIGVEPEVVQCAPANRVRVLVLCKRFAVPGNGITRLSNSPRHAAVTLVVKRAVVCPAGLLGRSVKTDVAYVNPGAQGHAEGLNPAVEVHVKQSILIVPYASTGVGYLVAHKPGTIISGIRFNLVHRRSRTCPKLDGRLHTHSVRNRCKVKSRRAAADSEFTIGIIVKHVALVWMRLAPGILMRANVGGFAKIAGTRISGRDYIIRLNQDAVRHAVVSVAAVIVWRRLRVSSRKKARERIDPRARPDAILVAIQP